MNKKAKRNEQQILMLNLYEKYLLEEVFKKSRYRSRQEMLRDILVPKLEEMLHGKQ